MATRSTNNTTVSYGSFVNFPVGTHPATGEHKLDLHKYHLHEDGSGHRVKMPFICTGCGECVERAAAVTGAERGDKDIFLDDAELAAVEVDAGKEYEVLKFIPADGISLLYFGKPYYLSPDPKRAKNALATYSVFRDTLEEKGIVGVVKYTQRSKTHLAVLRPEGNVLVVQHILWPDELRQPEIEILNQEVKRDEKAMKMMALLIEDEITEFNVDDEDFQDEYYNLVDELIVSKLDGTEYVHREKKATVSDEGDMVAQLEKALKAKAEAKAAEAASKAAHPAGKKIAGKPAPRKTAARKSA
jgi:DNA end-binding protein Ku